MVKNPPAMQETWVQSLGWEDPLETGMATHSSILAGESHGWRSLAGCSPQVKESQTRLKRLSTTFYPLDARGTQSPTPALPVLTTTGVSGGHNRCWWKST